MPENNQNMDNCDFPKFEKNKYFYGKLMTVRDFETEQQYFDGKRHLINRLLHGTGIICGFTDTELVTVKEGDKEYLKIEFVDGGMCLTCCGHEIVVPPNTEKHVLDVSGKKFSDISDTPYLYLKYKPFDCGYIAVASSSSSCQENCCPGRVVDDFQVIALNSPGSGITCNYDSNVGAWFRDLENKHKACPQCGEKEENMVFIGTVSYNGKGLKLETEKNRIFFTSKELYQLLRCHADRFDKHANDFDNPHKVTAKQTEALVSLDGVKNPGGDIDFIKAGSIVITPNNEEKSITIGETHSERKDNPHEVTALQLKALVSLDGVRNPGGGIDLIPEGSIKIIPDDIENSIIIGETHSERKDNPHEVSAVQLGALKSVDGVSNPGGNIDLIEGMNIKITPDNNNNFIKFDCTLGLEVQPSEVEPKSVGIKNVTGTSVSYAREDHEHKLEENFVNYTRLSTDLQNQLDVLNMYLRERALKCSVSSFKKVEEEFKNEKSLGISLIFKKAVRDRLYEKEEDFIGFMRKILDKINVFKEEIKSETEETSFKDFDEALEDLKKALEGDTPLKVAAQQDEVCFYALELKRDINEPMFRALSCTVINFRKVAETFKSEAANNISLKFEEGIGYKVYEDDEAFIKFMTANNQLLKSLLPQIREEATEDSFNKYISAVDDLIEVIEESNDALSIAALQEEVCSAAKGLEPISQNPMYRALKYTATSFRQINLSFDSDVADKIADDFEEAVKNKVYENEAEFIKFMKENLQFLKDLLPDEVEHIAIEKDLTNYVAAANKLATAIESNKALEIAARQEDLCVFACELRRATALYRALRCTAVNFVEVADKFENKTAKKISETFENAVFREMYEEDNRFIDFITENFELFGTFAEEIRDLATKETRQEYITALERMEGVIGSGNARRIAEGQEEICASARQLDVHLVA